jgi:hypothetical protein
VRRLVCAVLEAAAVGFPAGGAAAKDDATVLRMYDASGAANTALTLADVARSSVTAAPDPITPGVYALYFRLTNQGVTKFDRLTRLLAQRGARLDSFQHLVFEVNGHVYARPAVDYLLSPHGLDGRNGIEIPGLKQRTATRLAAEIRHG